MHESDVADIDRSKRVCDGDYGLVRLEGWSLMRGFGPVEFAFPLCFAALLFVVTLSVHLDFAILASRRHCAPMSCVGSPCPLPTPQKPFQMHKQGLQNTSLERDVHCTFTGAPEHPSHCLFWSLRETASLCRYAYSRPLGPLDEGITIPMIQQWSTNEVELRGRRCV